ncbi:MAG: dTDP-4-dehydrorhamnose reductase [Chlamydiia bacterium]|nr:dTDP-4-dehydrorhamnose reductase [Chlamydiia bacterium]
MIWVVGAGGLLGSSLKKKAYLATTRQEADVSDLDSLWKIAKAHPEISHMINASAFSQVDLAEEQKEKAYQVNALGPKFLAEIAGEIGAKFVHISTDYVFDGKKEFPLTEEDETIPCNYYGWSKLEGEKGLFSILPQATVIRTSWIFGKGGKSFVARMIEQLMNEKELFLTNDQWGRATFVEDLAKAIFQMLDTPGLYHFAGEGVTTRYQFACAMKNEMERLKMPMKATQLFPVPGSHFICPAKRPKYSALATDKIEKIIGPIRPWKEGLQEFLEEICDAHT